MAYHVKTNGYAGLAKDGTSKYYVDVMVDTAADIPNPAEHPEWEIGSELVVLENGGSKYQLSNAREWVAVNFNSGGGGGSSKIKISDMHYFCYNGVRVDCIKNIDTSECTKFTDMFLNASTITSIPEFDTSSGVEFKEMFKGCNALTTINMAKLHTGECEDLRNVFQDCYVLTAVPKLDTSSCTNFSGMFDYCKALTDVEDIDMSRATYTSQMFRYCESLANLRLYNLRCSVALQGDNYGKVWECPLTVDSIVHTIKELCKVENQQTLTIGSTNLAKIAALYCRVTDDTTEKIDMELCESTDTGAMTLSAYAALKNWALN